MFCMFVTTSLPPYKKPQTITESLLFATKQIASEDNTRFCRSFFQSVSNLGLSSVLIIVFAWISLADFISSMDCVPFPTLNI